MRRSSRRPLPTHIPVHYSRNRPPSPVPLFQARSIPICQGLAEKVAVRLQPHFARGLEWDAVGRAVSRKTTRFRSRPYPARRGRSRTLDGRQLRSGEPKAFRRSSQSIWPKSVMARPPNWLRKGPQASFIHGPMTCFEAHPRRG